MCENFVRIEQNVRIIHPSVNGKHTIVRIRIVGIIWNVQISEGQIMQALLHLLFFAEFLPETGQNGMQLDEENSRIVCRCKVHNFKMNFNSIYSFSERAC